MSERQAVWLNNTLLARTQSLRYLYTPAEDLAWNVTVTAPVGATWETSGGWPAAWPWHCA